MNDLTFAGATTLTMTSREIAELTGKRHDNVRADIEKMALDLSLTIQEKAEPSDGGRPLKIYHLNKRETLILVSGYSVVTRARIVDRWQELEGQLAPALPSSFAEALRLAADQAERIEAQHQQLEHQRPAVEFVDRYVEARSDKGLREVAKILGIKERDFIAELARTGVIFKQGANWLPYAEHQHAGRFTVKTGEANGHAFHQMRFTPEGVAWIARRFSKHKELA